MSRSFSTKIADFALRQALDLYAFAAARNRFYRFHQVAYRFVLRGLGVNNEGAGPGGEEHFLRWLSHGEGLKVVVDVGANIGDYSRLVRTKAPGARIVAIEPNSNTFERLEAAVETLNIESVRCALGREPTRALLYDYDVEGTGHASLHRAVITDLHRREAVGVEVVVETLDRLAARLGIAHIDLLKIDTEGNELACLQGAQQLLARNAIEVVQFEFNSMNLLSGATFKSFRDLLADFTFYRLFRDGMTRLEPYRPLECEIYGYQNIVAIRRGSRFDHERRH